MNTQFEQKPINISILALHLHWITADAIREQIKRDLERKSIRKSRTFETAAQQFSTGQTLIVFYALFYVVVEGYRELKLEDEAIDILLCKNDYEDRLRRFRNAVFHYQKRPLDKRLVDFLNASDSEYWIRALHKAFESFFLRKLPVAEIYNRIKNNESSSDFSRRFVD